MIKVSVVIPTFNRKALLEKVLISLTSQSLSMDYIEIIICDSLSEDGTRELIEEYSNKFSNIKHIHTDNIVSKKRNVGINIAVSDFVVLIDDDCVPEFCFLEKYIQLSQSISNQDSIVFCGEVRFPEDWVAQSNYYKFRDSLHNKIDSDNIECLTFNRVVTMNMGFYKSNLLTKIGGFDDQFRGYGGEDIEFGWRLIKAEYRILESGPKIYHYEPSSNIDGFMLKIHRSYRDGMNKFYALHSAAACSLKSSRLLEKRCVNRKCSEKIIGELVAFLNISILIKFIKAFVKTTDRVSFLFFPKLYKYLMLMAALQGISDRKLVKEVLDVSKGWYD